MKEYTHNSTHKSTQFLNNLGGVGGLETPKRLCVREVEAKSPGCA